MNDEREKARKAVEAIVRDLRDRRGLRQEWDDIDDDVKDDIRHEWEDAIIAAFKEAP